MPRTIPLVTTLLSCAVLAGCGAAGGPDESGPPVTFDACAPLQVVADPAISDLEGRKDVIDDPRIIAAATATPGTE